MMRCATCGMAYSRLLILPLLSSMMIVIRSRTHRWARAPARLERISLGADGDARGSIEAKKKEAPAKRTVKRARRTKKQCVPGRAFRWVENCLETKPSLDTQVFMSNCGSDILVGSRKHNLLDSSHCAYPCLSIAVPAAIKILPLESFWLGCILRVQWRPSRKEFSAISWWGKTMTVRPLKLWIGRGVDCVHKHQVLHPSMPSQKRGWSSVRRDNDWQLIMWMASVCWDGITKTMVGENHRRESGVFHRWKDNDMKRKAKL